MDFANQILKSSRKATNKLLKRSQRTTTQLLKSPGILIGLEASPYSNLDSNLDLDSDSDLDLDFLSQPNSCANINNNFKPKSTIKAKSSIPQIKKEIKPSAPQKEIKDLPTVKQEIEDLPPPYEEPINQQQLNINKKPQTNTDFPYV